MSKEKAYIENMELLENLDWQILFSGIGVLIALYSLKQSNDSKKTSQKLATRTTQIKINSQLRNAWDLMGGDIKTQSITKPAELSELNRAKRILDDCLILDPQYGPSHCHLGIFFELSGAIEKAECSYREAIKLDPKNEKAHNNLGGILLDKGILKEAKECILQAIKLDPEYVSAINNLGLVFLELNQYEDAKANFLHALEVKPTHVHAYANLGHLYMELEAYVKAKEYTVKALELDPKHSNAKQNLEDINRQIKKIPEA